MRNKILRTAPSNIFLGIPLNRKIHSALLAKHSNVTYSHCIRLIQIFEKKGYITRKKDGRDVNMHLTDKGKSVQNELLQLVEILG